MLSLKSLKLTAAIAAGVFVATILATNPANAASDLCTKRASMIKALSNKYEEQRRGIGIASKSGVMEIYISHKGTWTMLMTMPNGMSCIMAAGRDWEEFAAKPAGTNS